MAHKLIVSTLIFNRPEQTAKWLPPAIDNIYNDIKDVKFVISCQGGKSKEWLESYNHPAIEKIFHSENIGKAAHNKVFNDNKDSELFLELDDDADLPNHIMKYCLKAFDNLPEDTGFLGVGCRAQPYRCNNNSDMYNIIRIEGHNIYLQKDLRTNMPVIGIFRMCRSTSWHIIGGHPPDSFYGTDAFMGYKAYKKGLRNAFIENINGNLILHKSHDTKEYRKWKTAELKRRHKWIV